MPTASTASAISRGSWQRSIVSKPTSRSVADSSSDRGRCRCCALLLKAATLFTIATTGLRLTDTHNGLRAFTRRGAAVLRLRQNRMAHASEILADIARSGLRYVEVGVTIDYTEYSLRKGQRAGDFLMILVDLFAQRLYR